MKKSACSLALGAFVLASTPALADAMFSDTTFAPGTYQLGFAASSGGATVTQAQCTTCGDPGTALRLTISDSDGSSLGAAFVNTAFTYNPKTQGAIASIAASVDKNLTVVAPPLFGFGNTFRPVIEQDGNFYTAVLFGPAVTVPPGGTTATSGYNNFSLPSLAAIDFDEFNTTTGLVGTAHPNFGGDLITFGIGQVVAANAMGAGNQETIISDFDNLSITVRTATAVPEPSTWTTLLGALGVFGLLKRRRQHPV